MTKEEIAALVKRAQGHDEGAQEELLVSFRPLVKAIARRYYLIGGDSEDVVQEGMIGLYGAIRSYDADKNDAFPAYAAVCIHRRIRSAVKNANRLKHLVLSEGLALAAVDGIADAESAEDAYFKKERLAQFEAACKKLSEEDQNLLELYLNGFSYAEMAQRAGMTPKRVDNRLQYIKNILRTEIV